LISNNVDVIVVLLEQQDVSFEIAETHLQQVHHVFSQKWKVGLVHFINVDNGLVDTLGNLLRYNWLLLLLGLLKDLVWDFLHVLIGDEGGLLLLWLENFDGLLLLWLNWEWVGDYLDLLVLGKDEWLRGSEWGLGRIVFRLN